jgi:hypothetical protein
MRLLLTHHQTAEVLPPGRNQVRQNGPMTSARKAQAATEAVADIRAVQQLSSCYDPELWQPNAVDTRFGRAPRNVPKQPGRNRERSRKLIERGCYPLEGSPENPGKVR